MRRFTTAVFLFTLIALAGCGNEDARDELTGAQPVPSSSLGLTEELAMADCGTPAAFYFPDQSSIQIEILLTSTAVRSGQDFDGTIRLRNVGSVPYDLLTDATIVAKLYSKGTTQVVGRYLGGLNDQAAGGPIAPGGELVLDLVGGTASCDSDSDATLKAGDYDMVAIVPRYTQAASEGGGDLPPLVSEPVAVTVS